MKKMNVLFASALLFTLAGCSDAQAKLKDSNEVLLSIGNKTITKGALYANMNAAAGATTAINDATKVICAAEVEITDEMKESAQETLDSYKSMYGDTFTSYLSEQGMSEEDYLNDNLIPSLQAEQLSTKYVEQNWKNVVALYKPVKATILEFTSDDDAKAALSELKDGSKTAAEAASGHNSSSDGQTKIYTTDSSDVDSIVRTVLNSNTPDNGWSEVPSSDGSAYYVVKVDDNDAKNFKDEAISTLTAITQVSTDANTYFFKKYGFHVYDKTIYDALASNNPDYLVQDSASTATAEPASSTNE